MPIAKVDTKVDDLIQRLAADNYFKKKFRAQFRMPKASFSTESARGNDDASFQKSVHVAAIERCK